MNLLEARPCLTPEGVAIVHYQEMHDYTRIPDHLRESLVEWVLHARPTGSCLAAILRGDLFDAVARADAMTLYAIPTIASWLWNRCPGPCFGSAKKVEEWKGMPEWRFDA